jgi:glycosyltransferase involved in cell wall biosynthesis
MIIAMRICITRANKNAYSETFIRDQIEGLSRYTEVDTVYSGWMPEKSEDGKRLNTWLFWVCQKVIKKMSGKRVNYFSNYGLMRFLRTHKSEVVLANYGVAGACVFPACRKLNLPLVVHFHGFDATHRETLLRYGKQYRQMFRYASAVIAVSNEMKNRLIALGALPDRLYLNPYGIDTNIFPLCHPADNPPNFVSVGRFTPKKAPDLVIRAFHEVVLRYPEAHLTMVGGEDGLLSRCKSLAKELSLEKNIDFPGVLDRQQVSAVLSRARAFVQHSVTAADGDMEGTPVAVLEASTSGLPVVATKHGGIMDAVVDGETGFLVEEHDVKAMAEYMIKLIEYPALAREMGMKGRHHMEANYALERQISRLYGILGKAAGENRGHG